MFITYESKDEVIVTTKRKEKAMLKEFFKEGCRKKRDYGRTEIDESGILIVSNMEIN